MEEQTTWKIVSERVKEEREKKQKWIRFFIKKWIDSETKLAETKEVFKSDGALRIAIRKRNPKLFHEVEDSLTKENTKFKKEYDQQIKELEHHKTKYEAMFRPQK